MPPIADALMAPATRSSFGDSVTRPVERPEEERIGDDNEVARIRAAGVLPWPQARSGYRHSVDFGLSPFLAGLDSVIQEQALRVERHLA